MALQSVFPFFGINLQGQRISNQELLVNSINFKTFFLFVNSIRYVFIPTSPANGKLQNNSIIEN